MAITENQSYLSSIKVKPSIFVDRPSTIFFDYPKGPKRMEEFMMVTTKQAHSLKYKSSWKRKCIIDTFRQVGITCFGRNDWICAWSHHLPKRMLKGLKGYQRVNHFPGTWTIGRKDNLVKCLRRARRYRGVSTSNPKNAFEFHPTTYILPQQYNEWVRETARDKTACFIMKPKNSSNGKKIILIKPQNRKKVSKSKPCIIQRYIESPYLFENKKKFDLRLFVLVTSYEPLIFYLHNNGLVRFSSFRYHIKKSSRLIHLTNASIHKNNDAYVAPRQEDGCYDSDKWNLQMLWKILTDVEGEDAVAKLKQTIDDVITKTIIASESEVVGKTKAFVKRPKACFELFGFDILLDSSMKPWLLECNISPSLSCPSPLDYLCKSVLFSDIMHLIGLMIPQNLDCNLKLESTTNKNLNSCRARSAWRKSFTPRAIKIADISEQDWEIIYDFEDEYKRRGNFRLLFPTKKCEYYLPYLSTARYSTCLLCSWVLHGRKFSSVKAKMRSPACDLDPI